MPEPVAPAWEIQGQFLSNESGRRRGVVLRYWAPEGAQANRMLEQLSGDPELVALLLYDIATERKVAATPTSEQITVRAEDGSSVFLAAARYFDPGYIVKGDPGVKISDIPAGAQS